MYTDMQDVINVVTQNLKNEVRNQQIDMIQSTMDRNMLSVREQAKSLSLKHGLSEEALLIEEEERKLNQLIQGAIHGAFAGVQYHEDIQSRSTLPTNHLYEEHTLKKTNSGNHLISPL